jgi:hypothetical protein
MSMAQQHRAVGAFFLLVMVGGIWGAHETCLTLEKWSEGFHRRCGPPNAGTWAQDSCPLSNAAQLLWPEPSVWVMLAGDSVLRGQFYQMIHEIVHDRTWPHMARARLNTTTWHMDHLFCVKPSRAGGVFPKNQPTQNNSERFIVRVGIEVPDLLVAVTTALTRKYSCISWSWAPLFSDLHALLQNLANRSVRVSPRAIIFNQGLHHLIYRDWTRRVGLPRNLAESLTLLETLRQKQNTRLVFHSPTYFDAVRVGKKFRRKIIGNSADFTDVVGGYVAQRGIPIVPAYNLSLLPVVSATLASDGLHYGAPFNRRMACADLELLTGSPITHRLCPA